MVIKGLTTWGRMCPRVDHFRACRVVSFLFIYSDLLYNLVIFNSITLNIYHIILFVNFKIYYNHPILQYPNPGNIFPSFFGIKSKTLLFSIITPVLSLSFYTLPIVQHQYMTFRIQDRPQLFDYFFATLVLNL